MTSLITASLITIGLIIFIAFICWKYPSEPAANDYLGEFSPHKPYGQGLEDEKNKLYAKLADEAFIAENPMTLRSEVEKAFLLDTETHDLNELETMLDSLEMDTLDCVLDIDTLSRELEGCR